MRRTVVLVVVAVAVAAAIGVVFLRERPRWSLRDPEALAAWEAALEAEQKLYTADEIRHLERVLELAPGYPPAAVILAGLLRRVEPERAERLMAAARERGTAGLTLRERFMVELWVAMWDEDMDRVSQVIDRYTELMPDDPWVLNARARRAWAAGRYDEAEALYRRLLEVEPNLVIAHNQLGYLAMIRGDFEEAERRLVAYRFIAPDQANPHDSLGELYALTGRYDEARREFEAALEVRPDFCAARAHLVILELVAGDPGAAAEARRRMAGSPECRSVHWKDLDCLVRVAGLVRKGDWRAVWETVQGEGCVQPKRSNATLVLAHEAALRLGRDEAARALEEAVQRELGEGPRATVLLEWMRARRALAEGRPDEAARLLDEADGTIGFSGLDLGLVKLQLRLDRVTALRAAGRGEEAEALLAEVERINPKVAAAYRERGVGPIL